MALSDNIKVLREYSNMTQEEFAKQVVGVTYQAVSGWERGEREPRNHSASGGWSAGTSGSPATLVSLV